MATTPPLLAETAAARALREDVVLSTGNTALWRYPAQQPSRGTILFIHGYRGNHHGLEAIAGALPDFDILIPDLPGFGLSAPFKHRHSIVAYTGWLTELVAKLQLQDAIILGHSFGTIITAAAAAKGLANRLVLVNPVSSFKRTGVEQTLKQLTDIYYGVGGALPEKGGNYILKNPVFVRLMSEVLTKTKNKKLRNWIHQQHNSNFSEFAERRVALEGYLASTSRSVAAYAPNIKNDVLLIVGELDDITKLADQQRVLRLFPNAQFEVIRGVGHLVHYETPSQAATLVREFSLTDD
jgi:pimeloyl-ACP methyl ester carboxylesterase